MSNDVHAPVIACYGYRPETGSSLAAANLAWLLASAGKRVVLMDWDFVAPAQHRFTDHPKGHVSIINLASVRDLEARLGREIDPLRFRANLYVEGWPAWAENGWEGRALMLGWAQAEVFKRIVRCAGVGVNPATAEPDMDLVKALYDNYGHMNCGIYVHISKPGLVGLGDACTAPQDR